LDLICFVAEFFAELFKEFFEEFFAMFLSSSAVSAVFVLSSLVSLAFLIRNSSLACLEISSRASRFLAASSRLAGNGKLRSLSSVVLSLCNAGLKKGDEFMHRNADWPTLSPPQSL
jgi:hypothetical protein